MRNFAEHLLITDYKTKFAASTIIRFYMISKKTKFLVVAFIAMVPAITIYSGNPGSSPRTTTLGRNYKGKELKPRVPSRQIIDVVYNEEVLSLTFAYPEGECTLTLTEDATGFMTTHTFDSSDCSAEVYVGNIGPTTLELQTELGQTYTGHLD